MHCSIHYPYWISFILYPIVEKEIKNTNLCMARRVDYDYCLFRLVRRARP